MDGWMQWPCHPVSQFQSRDVGKRDGGKSYCNDHHQSVYYPCQQSGRESIGFSSWEQLTEKSLRSTMQQLSRIRVFRRDGEFPGDFDIVAVHGCREDLDAVVPFRVEFGLLVSGLGWEENGCG